MIDSERFDLDRMILGGKGEKKRKRIPVCLDGILAYPFYMEKGRASSSRPSRLYYVQAFFTTWRFPSIFITYAFKQNKFDVGHFLWK
ncbi:unnamed protein product [marine sediment metagenome]|uniref:Uncharacterized protein n=1 Tax=marine sediment metagenome TaxID=412755 RepID=X1RCJ7_9ZZZZ